MQQSESVQKCENIKDKLSDQVRNQNVDGIHLIQFSSWMGIFHRPQTEVKFFQASLY